MAFRIKDTEKKEADTLFYLERDDNSVSLCVALEGDTRHWYVCSISKDGMFLYSGIEKKARLKIDKHGVIIHKTDTER